MLRVLIERRETWARSFIQAPLSFASACSSKPLGRSHWAAWLMDQGLVQTNIVAAVETWHNVNLQAQSKPGGRSENSCWLSHYNKPAHVAHLTLNFSFLLFHLDASGCVMEPTKRCQMHVDCEPSSRCSFLFDLIECSLVHIADSFVCLVRFMRMSNHVE